MNAPLPVGWGYAPQPKEVFDHALAVERERAEQVAREMAAAQRRDARMRVEAERRASTHGKERQLHMRVALWLHQTIAIEGVWPSARRVHETFGVSLTSAYALLADFELANHEERP